MDETRQPGILIGQIYVERAEFSHREDALNLPPNTQFQPNLQVRFQGGVGPDEKTGFVRISVQTRADDKPLYNIALTMIALLLVDGKKKNLPLKDYVRGAGPVMLYPFAREAVAGLTWRGRFGPIWMNPFNLSAVLDQIPGVEAAVRLPKVKRARRAKASPR